MSSLVSIRNGIYFNVGSSSIESTKSIETSVSDTKVDKVSEKEAELQLVKAASNGDKEAYRILVEKYEARLLRCARDVIKDNEDARDIVQDALVKAYLSLPKFRGDSSFYTWIYRIVFHLAIDAKRKVMRRGGEHKDFDEKLSSQSIYGAISENSQNRSLNPDEQILNKEKFSKVKTALATLSEDHRQVIMMREVEGFSYEEIGKMLNITLGTVMSRLFYARKAMQKVLVRYQNDDIAV